MYDFKRFRDRLQEKADNPAARPAIYVAMGDSVTHGIMEDGVVEHERIYHQLLRKRVAKRFPNSILNVINSGVSGDTAVRSRERWAHDVICYKPDLVTIKFGLNDAHGGPAGVEPYIGAIRDLVRLVRSETEADLLLLTPSMMMKRDNPFISEGHRRHIPAFTKLYEDGHLLRYVEALRAYAAEDGLPLLDVYAMWEKMEAEGVDIHTRLSNGINHPDRPFHEELAEALEAVLFADVPASSR
ncbi:SGNH/GDSL hydrolase family protein [Paenibacillus sp. GYB003]|uniref:SGNH/GDSL hydrolase family protein n=1 Tax=Paenibacillus sp. GYB003 TaxID=2994392 RepID=UPI002F961E98